MPLHFDRRTTRLLLLNSLFAIMLLASNSGKATKKRGRSHVGHPDNVFGPVSLFFPLLVYWLEQGACGSALM